MRAALVSKMSAGGFTTKQSEEKQDEENQSFFQPDLHPMELTQKKNDNEMIALGSQNKWYQPKRVFLRLALPTLEERCSFCDY